MARVFGVMALRNASGSRESTNFTVRPSFGKRVMEELVGAAVKIVARDDFIADLGDGQQAPA